MHTKASARSLADELDALARQRSGRARGGARRRANELRLEAILLRRSGRAPTDRGEDDDPR